ncbi:sulfotransferase [Pseudomaricurvus sp. HS19]|uniref:sulfotransferase family protein n=1 Tax=Pseudomaricurvus sp. HS19 TaxID=2692626 RepID=UPI00136AE34F|nr:hypothetical protein [Pseudomaricurvus sp. HS19]
MKKPNFFLIGVPKAGTTSIHEVLSAQDHIFMSELKEPHFFSNVGDFGISQKNIRSDSDYYKLFSKASAGDRVIGESSTSYFYSKPAMESIKEVCPDAKILIVLRDPIDRLLSHWSMDVREGVQKKSLFDAIEEDYSRSEKGYRVSHMYIECGRYYEGVKNAMEIFGGDNVFICLFDDLMESPSHFYKRLFVWLGLSGSFYSVSKLSHSNKAGEVKNVVARKLFHFRPLRRFLAYWLSGSIKAVLRSLIMSPAGKVYISVEEEEKLAKFFSKDLDNLIRDYDLNVSSWRTVKYLK